MTWSRASASQRKEPRKHLELKESSQRELHAALTMEVVPMARTLQAVVTQADAHGSSADFGAGLLSQPWRRPLLQPFHPSLIH